MGYKPSTSLLPKKTRLSPLQPLIHAYVWCMEASSECTRTRTPTIVEHTRVQNDIVEKASVLWVRKDAVFENKRQSTGTVALTSCGDHGIVHPKIGWAHEYSFSYFTASDRNLTLIFYSTQFAKWGVLTITLFPHISPFAPPLYKTPHIRTYISAYMPCANEHVHKAYLNMPEGAVSDRLP